MLLKGREEGHKSPVINVAPATLSAIAVSLMPHHRRNERNLRSVSSNGRDVVVIGGGIVGTSAAAFLAEAGARVTLIEREGLASGASGANSGVVQHPFDPILAALYRETLSLYRALAAADLGFRISNSPLGCCTSLRTSRPSGMSTGHWPRLFPNSNGRWSPALSSSG